MSRAGERLGQHFLASRAILEKIIAVAKIKPTDTILEIGPGTGVLTRALGECGAEVIAVEKDAALADRLEAELQHARVQNIRIIRGDILRVPWGALDLGQDYRVIANIPYYLTGRLIRRLVTANPPPQDILLMLQREVAERITTAPPRMNLLAISVQAYAHPKILFPVPREAFSPRPHVDSAIVELTSISKRFFETHGIEQTLFFKIVRAGFHTKRKTIANSLGKYFGDKKTAEAILESCAMNPAARAETIPLERWASLVRASMIAER